MPNNQGQNFQNQGFANQAPQFQNQVPQGFPTNPNQDFHPSSQGSQNQQLYQPPHKRSLEDIVTWFVQAQKSTNTEFRTALNDVRSHIPKLISYMGNFQQEKGKLPSQTIQNPQGQNSVGISSLNDVRLSPLFEVEKQLIKPFSPKNCPKKQQNMCKMNH